MNSLAEAWRKWFECRDLPLPREAQLNRLEVKTMDGLIKLLKSLNGKRDCYVSVYSIPQVVTREIDVIFIETDDLGAAKEIDKALAENKIHYVKVFSGNKGYHYYIPLYPVKVKNIKKAARNFVESLGIDDVVDPHVVGDLRRMARVPYTINTATGLYAVVVSGSDGFRDALNPTKIPDIKWEQSKLATLLILGYDQEEANRIMVENGELLFDVEYYPECILYLLDKARATRYLTHQERLHLGAYLLKFHEIDEVVKVFSVLEDFSERVTRYHLEKMGKNFKCYNCHNAKRLGMCPLRNQKLCMLYPSINLWV